jgi:thiamine biosynthesis lipoprotein ApbE
VTYAAAIEPPFAQRAQPPFAQHSAPVAQASWPALGTSVVLRSTVPDALASAREAVERELAAIDLACSRFRPDSELVRCNGRAGRPVAVGALLFEALELALDAARLTDGDVDPTVGRALELAGYDRDWSLLAPARGEPAPEAARRRATLRLRARSGWRTVELDPATRTVRVPSGICLDLGATAKAWAADRAVAAAHAAGGCGVLVSLGGDIAMAGAAPADGWRVRVTDDHRSDPSAPGQTISIHCGGLATSSTAVRRWSHAGHTMHHIIDPATGAPARSCWRTVSVAAGDCAQANIAATAALVRSRDALEWLDGLGLPARLQDHDGRIGHSGDWPAPARAEERGGR